MSAPNTVHETDQVLENLRRAFRGVHVGKRGEYAREDDTREGHSHLSRAPKNRWCLSMVRETKERTRPYVDIRVRRAEDKEKEAGVHNVRVVWDAGELDGDDERACARAGLLLGAADEPVICVRDCHS